MQNNESKKLSYRAFISYSRKDVKQARRLHRTLEAYKVPRGINFDLPADRKLGRFFRDDDELAGSSDLGATLRSYLENAENLIVICSPHSAQSEWVNKEIIHFKTTDRADCIFAVIVDGTPMSDDPNTECLPPALRLKISPDGKLTNIRQEALGIDIRIQSYRKVVARLVTGMLNLSFDSLWQRGQRAYKKKILKFGIWIFLGLILLGVLGILQARELWIESSISLAKTAKQENDARRFGNGLISSLAAFPQKTTITTPIVAEARSQLERSGYNNRIVARWFYGSEVYSISFSPDGKALLTGDSDGRVILRKVLNGVIIHSLQIDSSSVLTASFSPRGDLIATGNNEGRVAIWNSKSGELVKTFLGNTSKVIHVSFSNNGEILLTTGHDGYVRLWDTDAFKKILEFKAHENWVIDAIFSEEDSTIWTTSDSDKAIRLWDVHSGSMLKQFYTDGDVKSITLSPKNSTILTAEVYENVAHLRNPETGTILRTYIGPEDGLTNAVISPDGKSVAGGGSEDGKIWLWGFKNEQVFDEQVGHTFRVLDVAFSINNSLLASSGIGGFVNIWSLQSPLKSIDQKWLNDENLHAMTSFKLNNITYIISAHSLTNDLQIWEASSGALITTLSGHKEGITHVKANSSGTLLLSSSYDGTVRVWDLKTKKQLQYFVFPFVSKDDKGVWCSIFTETNNHVLSAGRDSTVRTWSIDTGKEIDIIKTKDQVIKMFLSPDEEEIITSTYDGTCVEILRRENGDLLRQFYPPPDGLGYEKVLDITISPDGMYIAAASSDHLAVMWEVETGKEIHRFKGHSLDVLRVLFSPNGRNLVTIGSGDASLCFWDTKTGESLFLIPNHNASNSLIFFENSGRELVSLNDDNILTFWEVNLSSMSNMELFSYARKTWPEGLTIQGESFLSKKETQYLISNKGE